MDVETYLNDASTNIKILHSGMTDSQARAVAAVCLIPIVKIVDMTAPNFFAMLSRMAAQETSANKSAQKET